MTAPRNRPARALIVLTALWLSGCAGVAPGPLESSRATDLWDASLLPVRQIDLQALAFASGVGGVSGFVSAIAVEGDRLYAVDTASGHVLEVSLATESLRTLGVLRDGSSQGLLAGSDGRVYALDPLDRSVLVIDPFFGQQHRVALGGAVARPVDIALVDERDLAVVDGLDGGIVMVGLTGGVVRELPLYRQQFPTVTSPRSVAHAAGIFLVLDERADEIVGFEDMTQHAGLYAGGDLRGVKAMTVDDCGRFFVADEEEGTIYIGIPDMSIPGIRMAADGLSGRETSDLATDGTFLYVASRAGGISVYLVDPGCD